MNQTLLIALSLLAAVPGRVKADTLMGSFNLQNQTTLSNQASAAGLATRTSGGDASTQGLVAGTASFLVGHTIGLNGYAGATVNVAAGEVRFNNMTRYAGSNSGGITFWDFDLSTYLAGKNLGFNSSQVGVSIKLNYAGRQTGGSHAAPIYISYDNGSNLTLDSTVTTSVSPVNGLNATILGDTSHFVKVGEVKAGPPASGTLLIDITAHLLASTNKVIRIACFTTEYYGDIFFQGDSGLVETAGSGRVPIPFATAWHDWDAINLSKITTSNGSAVFVEKPSFESPYALEFSYNPNSSITFPYRYAGSSIFYGGWFFASLFDPATSVNETIKIEFIDGGAVKSTITLHPERPFWNRVDVSQAQRYDPKPEPAGFSLDAYIPADADSIRISPPQGRSGMLYIGKLFLGPNAKVTELDLEKDNVAPVIAATQPTMPASVSAAQSADIAQVRARLEETLEVAPYVAINSISATTMNDLQIRYDSYNIQWDGNTGTWSGYNLMMYQGAADYNSNEHVYGTLMLDVAQAYRNISDTTQRDTLRQMYFNLFDYAESVGGMPDNWSGGYAQLPSLFLMRGELSATGRLTPLVRRSYRDRIGYNRIFLSGSLGRDAGVLGEDVDFLRLISIQLVMNAAMNDSEVECVRDLRAVSDYFSNIAFQYGSGTLDGYRPDGLAYHHWGWINGYGGDCTRKMPRILYSLAGTEFRISEAAHRLIRDSMIGLDWLSLYSIVPATLSGKDGFPYAYGGEGHPSADAFAYLALSGTPDGGQATDPGMAGLFRRSYADFLPNSTAPSAFASEKAQTLAGYPVIPMPEGTRIYSYGNMVAHRKDGWLMTIKGNSKFQYTRESSDPWVTYLGYGMLDRVNAYWLRYGATRLVTEFGVNGYDWRKYPGTTTIDFANIQNIVNKEYKRYWDHQTFVGGTMQEPNSGLFTMRLNGSSLNGLGSYFADKSWFFFDGTVVAMGSGITNTVAAEPTITTIYQDKITSSTPTYYNSTTGSTGLSQDTTTTLGSAAWMVDSGSTGYWVPSGSTLTVKRGTQSNPNWTNDSTVSGDFGLAFINHGNAPSGAKYWYVQTPQSTPAAMSGFNTAMNGPTPPIRILAHTANVHAVWSEAQKSYGIVVFSPSNPVAVREVLSVSRPCTLMMHEGSATTRNLSIADPDIDLKDHATLSNNEDWGYSQAHTLSVTLSGLWNLATTPSNITALNTDAVLNTTTITLTLKEGLTTELGLTNAVTGSYSFWTTSLGIAAEPAGGDYDKDSLSNLMEYALGKDPKVSSAPAGVFAGNTIFFTKGVDAISNGDVSWIIETSTALAPGSWIPQVTQPAGDPTPAISLTLPSGTPARIFARLRVVHH